MRPEEADIATENVSDQYNSSNSTDSSNRIVVTELKRKLSVSVYCLHSFTKKSIPQSMNPGRAVLTADVHENLLNDFEGILQLLRIVNVQCI